MKETIKPSKSTKTSGENALPSNRTEQIKIQGILTSNLRTRLSSDTPYMAFLRLETADFTNHSLAECSATKCKDCEIPVIFRLKEAGVIHKDEDTTLEIRPKLKKGKKVILEGQWAKSNGNRPSFTCYSYRVLEGVDK